MFEMINQLIFLIIHNANYMMSIILFSFYFYKYFEYNMCLSNLIL